MDLTKNNLYPIVAGFSSGHAEKHGLRTPRESFFLGKSQTFGQTNWAEHFWSIWFGVFSVFWTMLFISIHFGTVGSVSIFSINQPLFLQKTKPLFQIGN